MYKKPSGVWIMAYTTIDDPSAFFQCTLYTGNGGTQSITNTGNSDLQPDMVWIKARNLANEKTRIVDSVRGAGVALKTTDVGGDASEGTGVTAFNSDGFSLGAQAAYNNNTNTFVSWQWKESATAGFDIVAHTGNSSNHTVAHSLSAVPEVMVSKNRSANSQWQVYTEVVGNGKALQLNAAAVADTSSTYYNTTTPTSSVFTVGTDTGTNGDGNDMIVYLFRSVQGFSKFGSYYGNANAYGTFLYTGFKPALFIFKDTESTTSWIIKDNKRLGYNGIVPHIQINTNDTENTDGWSEVDFLSNGIKLRNADNSMNKSGSKFIFWAFAENPLVTSGGVPTTAK